MANNIVETITSKVKEKAHYVHGTAIMLASGTASADGTLLPSVVDSYFDKMETNFAEVSAGMFGLLGLTTVAYFTAGSLKKAASKAR